MKQGNKKKILIIAITTIVLIGIIVGVVLALSTTDFMKSNKDLFFKYASQIFDRQNGLGDSRLKQYNEKKKNTVYENYGEITADVSSENLDEKTLDKVNDLNISFVGNIDNPNQNLEELIKINYSDDVNFAVNVKKVKDSYGIKLNKVAKQYLVVEKDGISKLLEELGLPIDIDSIDFDDFATTTGEDISFTDDEIKQVKDLYLNNIRDLLDSNDFSKVSTSESEGYALELSNEKLKEILINVLETLKTDDIMKNKLNKIIGQELDENDIDSIIENINELEMQDGKTVITVYQSEGKLSKIEIQVDDKLKVEIDKSVGDDNLEYNIKITANINEQNAEILTKITYEGLQTIEDVKQNIEISLSIGNEEGYSYKYNISNEIKFIDSVEITNFEDSDSIILNNLSSERLSRILSQVGNKIQEVNAENMDKAGIKGENPLIYWVPGLSQGLAILNNTQNTIDSASTNNSNGQNNTQNTAITMDEVARQTFNSKYTKYEGENVKASDVKALIMEVIAGNMAEDREIKVTGDIKIINNQMPDDINNSKTYNVELEYDEDKYVNEINITEN